jgi:hypothetical protein
MFPYLTGGLRGRLPDLDGGARLIASGPELDDDGNDDDAGELALPDRVYAPSSREGMNTESRVFALSAESNVTPGCPPTHTRNALHMAYANNIQNSTPRDLCLHRTCMFLGSNGMRSESALLAVKRLLLFRSS